MGKGYFSVSFDFLGLALDLPDDALIIDVCPDDQYERTLRILVYHRDIPETPEIMELNPTRRSEIISFDWGLPE